MTALQHTEIAFDINFLIKKLAHSTPFVFRGALSHNGIHDTEWHLKVIFRVHH